MYVTEVIKLSHSITGTKKRRKPPVMFFSLAWNMQFDPFFSAIYRPRKSRSSETILKGDRKVVFADLSKDLFVDKVLKKVQ